MNRFIGLTIALCLGTGIALAPYPAIAQDKVPPAKAAKSKGKPQSELASKTAKFATVAAADAKVKGATPATNLDAGKKMVGKEGAIVGTVVKVFVHNSNSIVILNFAVDYKSAMTAVIKSRDFAKFPDLETLKDKKVLVAGKFVDFKGGTEIDLTSPDQIKIVK